MCHGNERVVQRLHGCDPFVRVEGQHLFQQVDKLPPVGLLCQDVCALQGCHVHLQKVSVRQTSQLCHALTQRYETESNLEMT